MKTARRISSWLDQRDQGLPYSADDHLLEDLFVAVRVRDEDAHAAGYFSSVSGGACFLHAPERSHISIVDIATSLSRSPRWGARTRLGATPISIAQHSVLASHLCRPEHALHALLHDADEAYLGDVISPLKKLLPEYIRIERLWALEIGKRFGLGDGLADLPTDVKVADLISLEVERHDLLERGELWSQWGSEDRVDYDVIPYIVPQTEDQAFWSFIARYFELTNNRVVRLP